jgi:nucleotide-binding universal stress UspA family protein
MSIGISMEVRFPKIVVGIDGSAESMKAAEYAISVAKMYEAELIAINVLTSDIGYIYSSPGVESPPLTVKEIILLAEDEAMKWFDKIKEIASAKKVQLKTEFIVAKRSVLSRMLEYIEEHNISLIVVGTRGRSGVKKMLLGSIASGLVSYSPCPVLVIKEKAK